MEKKLRIQLFDDEGRLIEDRLVMQDPEMSSGPKIAHQGLFRIEFTFENPDDIEKAKSYLDKIVGNIPLGAKKIKKKLLDIDSDPNFRESFLETTMEITNQDALIAHLRANDFKFVTTEFIKSFEFPGLEIKEAHENYEWMIRCIKYAKNPKSDKYDPMLIYGIQLLPEPREKIIIYLNGQYKEYVKLPIPVKFAEVLKKSILMKFPPYMTEEERDRIRLEIRQHEVQPDREFSKFFIRWYPYIENLPQFIKDKKR